MDFLDLKKNVWKVGSKEIPVKDIKASPELKKLDEMQYEAAKIAKEGGFDTSLNQLEYEKKWTDLVTKVGLGCSYSDLLDELAPPQARQLVGEVYIFLMKIGTIEKAKEFETLSDEILAQSKKLSKSSQNLEN